MTTDPLGYEVRRKDTQFYTLRKILIKQFPHIIIPPLPPKQTYKQIPRKIKFRERYYSRFLQGIARCEELKASLYVVKFLTIEDKKQWEAMQKDSEKAKFSKMLEDLITYKGQAKVQMGANSAAFCSKNIDYVDSYQILFKEII